MNKIININNNYGSIITDNVKSTVFQLRDKVSDFVGRCNQIDEVIQFVENNMSSSSIIYGIRGMAGIGKTELAITLAHEISSFFNDGQIFINLRGTTANPLSETQVLLSIIRAFNINYQPPEDIDINQLQGYYRSILSNRHYIIIADDAINQSQVNTILPPIGNILIITSRNRFILPSMKFIDLDILTEDESISLLMNICPRIKNVANTLAKICGYLPLALRISASYLINDDSMDVNRFIKLLNEERLDRLSDPDQEDPNVSVIASIRLSYNLLTSMEKDVLNQLGVFADRFSKEAADYILTIKEKSLEDILSSLRRKSLLNWDMVTSRYYLHDLIRDFAFKNLNDINNLMLRYSDYYILIAGIINNFYKEGQNNIIYALKQFDLERPHIEVIWSWLTSQDPDHKIDRLIVDLSDMISQISHVRYNLISERIPRLINHYKSAHRIQDKNQEGQSLGNLGHSYFMIGNIDESLECFHKAKDIFISINNQQDLGNTLNHIGNIIRDIGDIEQGFEYHKKALEIAKSINYEVLEIAALGSIGYDHLRKGNFNSAIIYFTEVLNKSKNESLFFQATAYSSLGHAYWLINKFEEAISNFDTALEISEYLEDENNASLVSWNKGLLLKEIGLLKQAKPLLERRVNFERSIGHPDYEEDAKILGSV